jgi:hypothetical protein
MRATDMYLTTAPSHAVSAGGVSFTVSAGSPHCQTRLSKVIMIWSFNTAYVFLVSLPGSAAHACKGPDRQSQSHTVTHSHTSRTSKVVCHEHVVASTSSWSIAQPMWRHIFECVSYKCHICMQCVLMTTHTFKLGTNMKAKTQSATLIRLRP